MSNLSLLKFVLLYITWVTFIAGMLGGLSLMRGKALRGIAAVLALTFINEQIDAYAAAYLHEAYITYHFFNPLQLLFLCWFFYDNFVSQRLKNITLYTVAGSMLFTIINSIFFQNIHDNPSNFLLLETFVLIGLAVLLFIEQLDSDDSKNIFKNPVFICSLAILSFNIFSFLWFLLIDYFRKHGMSYWSSISKIIYFSNILYYTLLLIAVIFALQKTILEFNPFRFKKINIAED